METKIVISNGKGKEIQVDAVYRLRRELGREIVMKHTDSRYDMHDMREMHDTTMDANNGTEP